MSDLAIFMQAVVTEFKIVPEKVFVSNEWEAAFWGIVLATLFLPLSGLFRLIDVWRHQQHYRGSRLLLCFSHPDEAVRIAE
jgi:hypothetical protein